MTSLEPFTAPGPKMSAARAWTAEGARVALVTCLDCGAAVLLDPGDEVSAWELHVGWHLQRDRT